MQSPSDNEPGALHAKAAVSVRWSMLGEVVGRSTQPLLFLIVGAFVTPAELGLLAVGMIVVGIAQSLQDVGFAKVLVRTDGPITGLASGMFWTVSCVSLGLTSGVYWFSQAIATFFKAPESEGLIQLLGVRLFLIGLSAVSVALLQREFKFKVLFHARLAGALVSAGIVVPLVLLGHGVWALALGFVGGSAVQAAWSMVGARWLPRRGEALSAVFGALNLSRWILLETFLAIVVNWLDSVLVGRMLGSEALGKYRMAASLVGLAPSLLLMPMLPVALSHFSRLQARLGELKQAHAEATRLATAVAFAQATVLAVGGAYTAVHFLGPRWTGTEVAIALFASKVAVDWISGFNSAALLAVGRPDLTVKQLSVVAVVSFPIIYLGSMGGLWGICLARLGVAVIDTGLSVFLAARILDFGFNHLERMIRPAIGASVLVLGLGLLLGAIVGHGSVYRTTSVLLAGVAGYLVALRWLAPGLVTELLFRLCKVNVR